MNNDEKVRYVLNAVVIITGAERLYMLIYVLFKNSRYICKENSCYFLIDYDYAGMT